jgi:hypothetical protein
MVTPKIAHHASWIGWKNGLKTSKGELRKMAQASFQGTGS